MAPSAPSARSAGFVPRSVVDEHPEVATWEGLADPAIAELFATDQTAPRGRLLGVSPDYLQYDEAIVANLGLPLEVEFSGSEAETIEALDVARSNGSPILVYWWTPTAAVVVNDLVNVELPARTDACVEAAAAGGAGVDCDYPEDVLFKAFSPNLATRAPEAEAFLRSFTLGTDEQAALIAAVEVEGRTIDDVARAWIEANEATWRSWLPAG